MFPDVEQVKPGESARAYFGFVSPKEHIGKVHVGMEFQVREGDRIVANGIVTKILELQQSANNAQ